MLRLFNLIGLALSLSTAPAMAMVSVEEGLVFQTLLVGGGSLAVILGGLGALAFSQRRQARREQRRIEASLRQSEQLNVATLNALPAHIAVLDRDGAIVMVNDAWREFARRNGDPALTRIAIGANYLEVCRRAAADHSPEAQTVLDGIKEVLAGRRDLFLLEYPCDAPNEPRWFLMNVAPLRSPASGAVITHLDITGRKQAEERLRQAKDYAERLLSAAAVMFLVLDHAGRVKTINRKGCEILRCAEADAIGQEWLTAFVPARIRAELEAVLQQVLTGDLTCFEYYENPVLTRDGQERLIGWRNTLLRDADGRVTGVLSSGEDITERRQSLNALMQSETRFRNTFENAAVGIAHIDLEGRWLRVNQRLCKIVGYSHAELLQQTFQEITHPDDLALDLNNARRLREGAIASYTMEKRYIHKNGSAVWVNLTSSLAPKPDGAPDYFIAVVEDITLRKRAEQALQESEERFRAMTETVPDILFTVRPDGWLDYVNPRFYDCTHLPPGAAEGWGWAQALHPDDSNSVLTRWRQALALGEALTIKYRLHAGAGGYRWFQTRAQPIYNAAGALVKWFGVSSDIDELVRAQDALRQADRRKDEFLAMLGHELRNPLAPIRNAVYIMRRLNPTEPRLQWVQQVIDLQVTHLTRLVDDLLDVSRIVQGKITLKQEQVELATIVRQAVEAARPAIDARKHRLTVKLPACSPRIEGDPVRLTQVLLNLLDNAAKYTEQGGAIWLELDVENQEAVLRVRDTGMGIPASLLPRVFELFEQGERALDRAPGGLGIGLTLVRHLIARHGGRVEAHSAGTGHGAEFIVHLPLLAEPPSRELLSGAAAYLPAERSGNRVLLVEDDFYVAESTSVLLELEGYEVRVARTAQAALELARTFRPRLALVDIGLPDMDGYELARRLRQSPETQDALLVALTGYGHEQARSLIQAAGFDHHFVKPLDAAALRTLLDGSPLTASQ